MIKSLTLAVVGILLLELSILEETLRLFFLKPEFKLELLLDVLEVSILFILFKLVIEEDFI